jgi:DNA replication and repair protein RecF
MAGLEHLCISCLRNISQAALTPHPQMNLIVGANGSGKTSLLEAIYLLGLGRSFRSRLAKRYISFSQPEVVISGKLSDGSSVGVRKTLRGDMQIKVNGTQHYSVAQLAARLPIHYINPDIYLLLDGGPRFRRQFLDWGVFHMEHGFYQSWKDLSRVIKQRNQALRSGVSNGEVTLWDSQLAAYAEKIDLWRQQYLEQFIPIFIKRCDSLLQLARVSLSYRRGWADNEPLLALLTRQLATDRMRGYTHSGPHHAELLLEVEGMPAKDVLSRGQQKMVLLAMKLAQEELMQQQTGKRSLFLLDDLASELDTRHLTNILELLAQFQAQVFITATDQSKQSLITQLGAHAMFHVEHGVLL